MISHPAHLRLAFMPRLRLDHANTRKVVVGPVTARLNTPGVGINALVIIATHNGRKLRRYQRRWKVERPFSWLGNFRRLIVRWARPIELDRGFFPIAYMLITLNKLLNGF